MCTEIRKVPKLNYELQVHVGGIEVKDKSRFVTCMVGDQKCLQFVLGVNEDIHEMKVSFFTSFRYPSKPNVIVVEWTGTIMKTDLQTFTGWTLLHIAFTEDANSYELFELC
jgi:hypothetical protein